MLCIPAVPQILRSFGTSNQLYSTIIVSVWEVGQAVGPLFVAPLSEMYGTTLVYNGTNIIFIVFSVACALSNKQGMLIAFRLFNGLGDSSQALNARIVGDMFPQQERGLPMSISGLPPLLGPVAGPIIGGYLTETEGWQWAFWLMAIVMGVLELTFVLVYRETYRPHLLRRKAQKLSKEAEGIRFISIDDVDKERPSWRTLATYLFRPAQILFRSPVVAMLAVIMSVIYGVSYTLLTTITEVFEGVYGFTQGEAGLAYLGLSMCCRNDSRSDTYMRSRPWDRPWSSCVCLYARSNGQEADCKARLCTARASTSTDAFRRVNVSSWPSAIRLVGGVSRLLPCAHGRNGIRGFRVLCHDDTAASISRRRIQDVLGIGDFCDGDGAMSDCCCVAACWATNIRPARTWLGQQSAGIDCIGVCAAALHFDEAWREDAGARHYSHVDAILVASSNPHRV